MDKTMTVGGFRRDGRVLCGVCCTLKDDEEPCSFCLGF